MTKRDGNMKTIEQRLRILERDREDMWRIIKELVEANKELTNKLVRK